MGIIPKVKAQPAHQAERAMKKRPRYRNTRAFTLVEALVSVLIGATITGVFLDTYSKMQRTGATTHNEACANAIAQELIEESRTIGFNFLAPRVGVSYELLTNRVGVGQSGPASFRQDPVALDLVKKLWDYNVGNSVWDPKVVNSRFPGTVTYKIEQAPGFSVSYGVPDAIIVSVIIKWTDGEKYAGSASLPARTIKRQVLITKTGVNKWTP